MSTLLGVKNLVLASSQTSVQIKVVNFLSVTYFHYSIKINLKYEPEGRRYNICILADILRTTQSVYLFMKSSPGFEENPLLFVNDGLSCSQLQAGLGHGTIEASAMCRLIFIVLFSHSKESHFFSWSIFKTSHLVSLTALAKFIRQVLHCLFSLTVTI